LRPGPDELSFEQRKGQVILRMFIDQADRDYVSARWAHFAAFPNQFLWSAAQCAEKYAKGLLLLKGLSVKPFGHDLRALFKEAEGFVGEAFQRQITTVLHLYGSDRQERSEFLGNFVDKLSALGTPDVRYGVTDTYIDGADLARLDALCYVMRCALAGIELDGKSFYTLSNDAQFSDMRREAEDWSLDHDLVLENAFWKHGSFGDGALVRRVFLSKNASFLSDEENSHGFNGLMFHGSPLAAEITWPRRLADATGQPVDHDRHKDATLLLDWFDSHIQLSKQTRAALRCLFQGGG